MITSSSNPTIKAIRGLLQRKHRDQSSLCLVEGIRLVGEAARSSAIESLLVAPELLRSQFAHELVVAQASIGTPIIELSGSVFASISQKDGPQGLAAVVRQRWQTLDTLQLTTPPGWVALTAPADPGNLGTIIRTVDAAGAGGVIIIGQGTDPYDPAALRAAMGATFAVGLVRTSWEEVIAWRRAHGVTLVGTSDQAPTHFQQTTYPQPLLLLMGSERQGLTQEQQAACDLLVRIPMHGRGDSLNLAVATGVMLYELLRQAG